ncbi:MBL fold metallo-hydrolase [Marinilabiliaceae bacterium N1Y90]|nr:MBL fold metallo-hydrolase [Marinilabiliaceae bacterium N1Y90]
MTFIILFALIASLTLITLIFLKTSPQFGASKKEILMAGVAASPNHKDGVFQNAMPTEVMTGFEWSSLPQYFTNGNKVPQTILPMKPINLKAEPTLADSITRVTWLGHSAALIEIDGKKLLLDPMLGEVPSPHPLLGSKRFDNTVPVNLDELDTIDAVIISHDHYDHLDYGSIMKLKDKTTHFYVPLGVKAHLLSWNIAPEKVTELDWWETVNVDKIKLTTAPARHFSGRGLNDRNSTLWCSWIIEGTSSKVYFSGDSGYGNHFKEIGEKYGPFDLALVECGQYNEQWSKIHMMPEETVTAGADLNAKLVLPIHWGAYKLALHDWDDPIKRAYKAAQIQCVNLTTPQIGEPIILKSEIWPKETWWVQKN